MNKKKALIILPSYSTGGAEKVIWSYFKNFKDSKISLKLLVVNAKGTCSNSKNKNIIDLKFSRFIYAIPRVLSILKSENINVVISTFPNISAILLFLKYLSATFLEVFLFFFKVPAIGFVIILFPFFDINVSGEQLTIE